MSRKIGKVVAIQSIFGFSIFGGFRSKGGQNFFFPIDFAGRRYTNGADTAQTVIVLVQTS